MQSIGKDPVPDDVERALIDPLTQKRMKFPVVYTGRTEIVGLIPGVSYEKEEVMKIAKSQNVAISEKSFYVNRALESIINVLETSNNWIQAIEDNLVDSVSFEMATHCLISPRGDLYSEEKAEDVIEKYHGKDPFSNNTLTVEDMVTSTNLTALRDIAKRNKLEKDNEKIANVEQSLGWILKKEYSDQSEFGAIKLIKKEGTDSYQLHLHNQSNDDLQPLPLFLEESQLAEVLSGNNLSLEYQLIKNRMPEYIKSILNFNVFSKDFKNIEKMLTQQPVGTVFIHAGKNTEEIVISYKDNKGELIHKNFSTSEIEQISDEIKKVKNLPLERMYIQLKPQLISIDSLEQFLENLNKEPARDGLSSQSKGSFTLSMNSSNRDELILEYKNHNNVIIKETFWINNQGGINFLQEKLSELNLLNKLVQRLGPQLESMINPDDLKLSDAEALNRLAQASTPNNTFILRAISDGDQVVLYSKDANGRVDQKTYKSDQSREILAAVDEIKDQQIRKVYDVLKDNLRGKSFDEFKSIQKQDAGAIAKYFQDKLPGEFLLISNNPSNILLKYLNENSESCQFRYNLNDPIQVAKLNRKLSDLNQLAQNSSLYVKTLNQFDKAPSSYSMNSFLYDNNQAASVLGKQSKKGDFIIHKNEDKVTVTYIDRHKKINHLDFKWVMKGDKEILFRNDSREKSLNHVLNSLELIQKEKKNVFKRAFDSIFKKESKTTPPEKSSRGPQSRQ